MSICWYTPRQRCAHKLDIKRKSKGKKKNQKVKCKKGGNQPWRFQLETFQNSARLAEVLSHIIEPNHSLLEPECKLTGQNFTRSEGRGAREWVWKELGENHCKRLHGKSGQTEKTFQKNLNKTQNTKAEIFFRQNAVKRDLNFRTLLLFPSVL